MRPGRAAMALAKEEAMMRRTAELAVVVVVGLLAACGHPEQTVVTQYFNAVKAKDKRIDPVGVRTVRHQ